MLNYKLVKVDDTVKKRNVYIFKVDIQISPFTVTLTEIFSGISTDANANELQSCDIINNVRQYIVEFDLFPESIIMITDEQQMISQYMISPMRYSACYIENLQNNSNSFCFVDGANHKYVNMYALGGNRTFLDYLYKININTFTKDSDNRLIFTGYIDASVTNDATETFVQDENFFITFNFEDILTQIKHDFNNIKREEN